MHLTPAVSPLRPHCSAVDRLIQWRPENTAPHSNTTLSPADEDRIKDIMGRLLTFHVACDNKGFREAERAPASTDVILYFISALTGDYAAGTIKNYLAGIRAWHIIHRMPWTLEDDQIEVMIRSAKTMAPVASKRRQRELYTPSILIAIKKELALSDPLDAAVWACATSLFYGAARVGELTIPKLGAFDPELHLQRSSITYKASRNGDEVTELFIPHTKTNKAGEAIYWAQQNDKSDPHAALSNHLFINNPRPGEHLFTHTVAGSRRPLTRKIFLSRISAASTAAKQKPLHGHSFRIGGTLEYLLRGVPFDTMQAKGRWASSAFLVYLRDHSEVMAPYMQANPEVHSSLFRLTVRPELAHPPL
ncbi:hypothetical protein HETIRDRAFT_414354 [Heterobasidion irregulare TC 32-1]|uniref:Tyr recombinase domain-containing protein n=1 Tax=Heterobasidion irregulare (strain TC 32-1) TaxID=747525 RepID=W4KI10_HETIT|nr:uncharacterized protein HETIRDRAFT_414354 [Heterobasidion irregulare TC 32-1]ETW85319.1 hypothetical protein HETIRDRAFT_414354 [Heterobasidion irregulare TC 32-1]